jgi:type I protein arginine methyltransferase
LRPNPEPLNPKPQSCASQASIYLTGIEDAKYKDEKIHFWDDVYGFNMSTVKTAALSEPLVDTVDPGQVR